MGHRNHFTSGGSNVIFFLGFFMFPLNFLDFFATIHFVDLIKLMHSNILKMANACRKVTQTCVNIVSM